MKCKLCDEKYDTRYRIPRNLICGHTFCEQCLKIYESSNSIECPSCNKTSPNKVPICYAIYEVIDTNPNTNNNESLSCINLPDDEKICSQHNSEKTIFFCKDCALNICANCLFTTHKNHSIKSQNEKFTNNAFIQDYKFLSESFKSKYNLLKDYKTELNKSEAFLNNIFKEHKFKLKEIENCLLNRKREKMESLNKTIEINYLTQQDTVSKCLTEVELKLNYINLYIGKIQELLEYYENQKISEFANFNILKTEDEFKKIRLELETVVKFYSFLENSQRG
jgi:hypothetical protein